MAWSELTARPEVNKIFRKLKLKYTLRRILEASGYTIQILHESELSIPTVVEILALFPDFIYVEFVPNTPFAEEATGDTYNYKGD
ncbi:hypothetical protein LCGC14_0873010 [marine sediment metagenome]|uniref:Uncharacterized protein n=1 Tax=marine sediment metagenome TaxID=412755 RepID=A0A0F9SB50_9ZZZZ